MLVVQSNLGREVRPNQRNKDVSASSGIRLSEQSLETLLLLTAECDLDYKTLMQRGGEREEGGAVRW